MNLYPPTPEPGDLYPTSPASDTRITLNLRKFGQQNLIPMETLRNMTATSHIDQDLDALVLRVAVKVLTQKVLRRKLSQRVGYPANPWQHFKERFAPAWFLSRWPVELTCFEITLDLDVDALYPENQIPINGHVGLVPIFHENAIFGHVGGTGAAKFIPTPLTYQEIRNFAAEARRDQNRR